MARRNRRGRRTRRPRKRRNYPVMRNFATNANVCKFKRTLAFKHVMPGDTLGLGIGFAFTLALIPGAAEIQNMFDEYRFTRVVFKLYNTGLLQFTTNTQNALVPHLGNIPTPMVYLCVDINDSVPPTSSNSIRQHANTIFSPLMRPSVHKDGSFLKHSYVPAMAVEVFAGVTPGYQSAQKKWLNTTYDDVEFYGSKAWMDAFGNVPGGTEEQLSIDAMADIYMEVRRVK